MVPHGLPPGAGRRRRLAGFLLASIAVCGMFSGVANARADESARIDIAYVPPKDPAHRPLHELLMKNRVLEKIQALLGPFMLPRRVLLKVEGCDGTANAYSGDDAVTVCYEYIDEIWRNVSPDNVDPREAERQLIEQIKQAGGAVEEAEAQVSAGQAAVVAAEQDLAQARRKLGWDAYVTSVTTGRLRGLARDAGSATLWMLVRGNCLYTYLRSLGYLACSCLTTSTARTQ